MPIKINGTNTAANPSITGSDTDTGIVYGSDQIDFSIGGSSKLTLDSSGDVLVGLTTALNTQSGSIQAAGPIIAKSYINAHTSNATVIEYISNLSKIRAYGATSGSGQLAFNVGGGGDATDFEAMRITNAGNVEIDSFNSPSTRTLSLRTGYAANANGGSGIAAKDHSGSAADGLGIYGTDGVSIHTANAGTVHERIRVDTSGNIRLPFVDGSTGLRQKIQFVTESPHFDEVGYIAMNRTAVSSAPSDMVFATGTAGSASERMRVTSDGHLLVGTTTDNVNSSTFGISLEANGSGHFFRNVDGGYSALRAGGNQGLAIIRGDGDLFNTNNSYGQVSDETLKQDIVDAASQWDDIKNLKVRKFRFKDNPTGVLQIGVIAQEIEKVSAGLVKEDSEGIKSVKYSVLYMKAVKCLQEAQAKIETLETENAKLQTDLTALTTRVAALEAA